MKYAQLVMGSAGTGKSTYCKALQEHCATTGRTVRVINLDPAAEAFKYSCSADVRDLVSVDDVMTELGYGPNGALIFAMEFLVDSHHAWLDEVLEGFLEDDYVLIDCPGQVELYSHVPVLKTVAASLQRHGFNVCGVYLVDALFVTDAAKLLAGNLMALSAMTHFELPHINVLSKCDLVDKGVLERYTAPSGRELLGELHRATGERFRRLNEALARVLDEYSMVAFTPLDITDEESLEGLLLQVDQAIQYGEDMEPKEPREPGDADGDGGGGAGGGDDDDADDALSARLASATRNAMRQALAGDDGPAAGRGGGGGGGDDGFYGTFARRGGDGGEAAEGMRAYFADTLAAMSSSAAAGSGGGGGGGGGDGSGEGDA